MTDKALEAAIDAYEADFRRAKYDRGTCIEIRASARFAAIAAFDAHRLSGTKNNEPEHVGLLAAVAYHDEQASAWHKQARHHESCVATEDHGLSKNLQDHADGAALLHREFAQDLRRLADRDRILRETPFKI